MDNNTSKIPARVLIIEDDKVALLSLKAALDPVFEKVEAAETGQFAKDLSKNEKFDIAIIDYRLPDIDGVHLIKELKDSTPDLMTLVVTAYSSVETAIESIKMGAYDYVIKPLDIAVLIHTMQNMLEDRKQFLAGKEYLEKNVDSIEQKFDDEQTLVGSKIDKSLNIFVEEKKAFNLKDLFKTIKNYYWSSYEK